MPRKENMGKRFEKDFLESFKGIQDVSIDRFYDVWQLRKNVSNKSDFVAYRFPHQFYFECKSYAGEYIPLSALSHSQYSGLLSKSKIHGVIAGAVLNYRPENDHPQTFFIDIRDLESVRLQGIGGISIALANSIGLRLEGTLKRTRYKYDVSNMMESLSDGGTADGKITNTEESSGREFSDN